MDWTYDFSWRNSKTATKEGFNEYINLKPYRATFHHALRNASATITLYKGNERLFEKTIKNPACWSKNWYTHHESVRMLLVNHLMYWVMQQENEAMENAILPFLHNIHFSRKKWNTSTVTIRNGKLYSIAHWLDDLKAGSEYHGSWYQHIRVLSVQTVQKEKRICRIVREETYYY